MDRIVLDHMEFYGYHGCLPEERQQGQTFFVDLTMQLNLRAAGEQDDLGQTVNYADVFTKIRGIVEGLPTHRGGGRAHRLDGAAGISSRAMRRCDGPQAVCADSGRLP